MDLHIHSNFSFDSKTTMKEHLDTASKLNIKKIAFTDHIDFDFPEYGDVFVDTDKYLFEIEKIQNSYPGIKILKSLEIGICKDNINKTKEYINSFDTDAFDFFLLSVHLVDGQDPYEREIYEGYSKNKLYRMYLEDIYDAINLFPMFDSLAHFDYIVRYAPYDDPNMLYWDFSDYFDSIFKSLIEKSKVFEINSGTYVSKFSDKLKFDETILARYMDLGGKYITIGSDAHDPTQIGNKKDYIEYTINKFNAISKCYFDKHEVNL